MSLVQTEEWNDVASILAGKHTGKTVRLRGWVHRQRSGGKIAFITLRDGSGTIQCTVKAGIAGDDDLERAKRALNEASIEHLEGDVVEDERAPGGYEVKVTRFQLHEPVGMDGAVVSGDFPMKGEQGIGFELDNRHLWLRSSHLSTILRVKHRLLMAAREFFDQEGFVEMDPSLITTNACEGGTTLFEFDYFGQRAYLSQSAQMYLEGCIFGNPKVFGITNSFRAEKSRTNKHLTEFHHLEAEYAWWGHEENLQFQERLVTHLAHTIAQQCPDELEQLGQDPQRLLAIQPPFERITYHEAAGRLCDMGFDFPDGEDFGTPHEEALTEGNTNPIFITHWPASIKAFYMKQDPDNPELVLAADMLAPDGFGEIIGGSERSEDVEWMKQMLQKQFEAEVAAGEHEEGATLELEPYEWYFDLRRYGSVPHSGFGLGVERVLRWFTNQEHIRDMLPYPRTPNRAYP